jgi:hypothetical protein
MSPPADCYVRPGDKVTLIAICADTDLVRPNGSQTPYTIIPGTGSYLDTWTITGDATFDDNNQESITTSGLIGNPSFTIKSTWTGATKIRVTVTFQDQAPNPAAPPDTGTAQDPPAKSVTWNFALAPGPAPTSIAQVASGTTSKGDPHAQGNSVNAWFDPVAAYYYQVGPDLNGQHTNYTGWVVTEIFDPATAVFAWSDLTDAWKAAHPNITTANAAAAEIFKTKSSSFKVGSPDPSGARYPDTFFDQTAGFGCSTTPPDSPFKPASLVAGVGWKIHKLQGKETPRFSRGRNCLPLQAFALGQNAASPCYLLW